MSATPGPVRAPQSGRRRHRRADHPADRPGRSRHRRPAGHRADRRPAGGDSGGRGARRARARDDADQAHGRGPDAGTTRSSASGYATCTRISTRSSACRSCATCGSARSTCWSASTCCARGWTCPRSRWSRSSTPTRKGSCDRRGALIQTIGRAARNVRGRAILYADTVTPSMRQAMDETDRRRAVQEAYNAEHGITPASIVKNIDDVLSSVYERDYVTVPKAAGRARSVQDAGRARRVHRRARARDEAAAANLEFERAAALRDRLRRLRNPDLAPLAPGDR